MLRQGQGAADSDAPPVSETAFGARDPNAAEIEREQIFADLGENLGVKKRRRTLCFPS